MQLQKAMQDKYLTPNWDDIMLYHSEDVLQKSLIVLKKSGPIEKTTPGVL